MKIKMEIIGFLGQNAKTGSKDGRTVMNFSVAHTVKFKNEKNEDQERTTWVNCQYWNDKAEKLLEYMKKGTLVCCEGIPSTRTYTNATGQIVASLDLNVKDLRIMSSKKDSEKQPENEAGQETEESFEIRPSDDL
ncbi:MAG: single-stranded DNA-binding protein [Bacteroidales bacterium]|jgi:single-strand DNA-binding protein|nr:single-stranded DNA-binding protein [Bacteroidales bacterium]